MLLCLLLLAGESYLGEQKPLRCLLGDLWSWNEEKREYIVSPTPDVLHFKLDLNRHKFLVVASDGVWNVFPPKVLPFYAYLLLERNLMATFFF